MTSYYNEIDPYATQWLRNLIKEGLIADGEVDTRSIVDVRPNDLAGFEQCHFFAGLGGWGGALRLAGVDDNEPLWTGSCPCQPFSLAGKQKGFDDDRHLWPVWRELIRERCPAKVFGEQVASASQWLGLVRSDLEAMGYAVGAIPVEAASAGADHLRDRYWFVANANGVRSRDGAGGGNCEEAPLVGDHGSSPRTSVAARLHGPVNVGHASSSGLAIRSITEVERGDVWGEGPASPPTGDRSEPMADANESCSGQEWQQRGGQQRGGQQCRLGSDSEACDWVVGADGKARRVKSGIRLLAHGVPARVAKLRALGNAIDLRPAAAFIDAALSAITQAH